MIIEAFFRRLHEVTNVPEYYDEALALPPIL